MTAERSANMSFPQLHSVPCRTKKWTQPNIHARGPGTWARAEEKRSRIKIKFEKQFFFLLSLRFLLLPLLTCDGISVSRGKKSFVHVMLLCTFFLVCVSLLLFFPLVVFVDAEEKKEFQALTPRKQAWVNCKKQKDGAEGKFLFTQKAKPRIFLFFI